MTQEEYKARAERQVAKLNEDRANGKGLGGGPSLDGPMGFVPDTPENEAGIKRMLDLINGVTPTER